MAELETALRQLGGEVAYPPTPDLASAIRERLDRPRLWRRPVAIALTVVAAVAIGAAFAVPQARTAILDWLGLRNVSVVRVDKLPNVPASGRLDLGRQVTLDEAKRRAPWLLVPDDEPDRVYVNESVPGGKVSLVWGTPSNVRLLLTELSGRVVHREGHRVGRDGRAGADRQRRSLVPGPARRHVPGPERQLPRQPRTSGRKHPRLAGRRRHASARRPPDEGRSGADRADRLVKLL